MQVGGWWSDCLSSSVSNRRKESKVRKRGKVMVAEEKWEENNRKDVMEE